jgi:predicted FMN-binding regulatory protein PaiB
VEAKFKLSQNRKSDDRSGVIGALEMMSDENSLEMARLMKRHSDA